MVKQDVPLQPMEYHGGAGFHTAARGGDHGGAGGPAPTEAAACGRPLPKQIPGRTCSPWRGDHAGAAYFSPTDGAKLLTTDQRNEIRVYSCSDWTKPQHLIPHPHRQFQHLTPIKATWHPRYDLIVAGRYPDPKFPGYTVNELRTVDIFDGNTGEMVCQLHDPNASGIISLNKFNPMGDTLASGMGFNILIWSREEMVMKKQEHLLKAMTEQGIGSRSLSRRGGQRQANPGTSKLKAKLLSWDVEEMRTKSKDSKSQARKRKGKDLEN